MSRNNDIFTLPAGPAELCFDKNEFMKTSFSVDDFLHENRNAGSLEAIRDDLGIYLKVLRSSMIELINEDYADFVNLSANLIGLDQSINKIQKPLDLLRDDIQNVQQTLKSTMDEIVEIIDEKNKIRNNKFQLKCYENFTKSLRKLNVLLDSIINENSSSSNSDSYNIILERISLQVIQINFNQKFCQNYIEHDEKSNLTEFYSNYLNLLKNYFLDAMINSNERNLLLSLKIYLNIDEIKLSETIVSRNYLHNLLKPVISEKLLEKYDLSYIYQEIFGIVQKKFQLLLKLTKQNNNYNYIINSLWNEIEQNLEINLSSIFAPGNPDVFYAKYHVTLDFLKRFETLIGDNNKTHLPLFHSNQNYKTFLNKWNLPVYFQIRFQEIGGFIEGKCNLPINNQLIITPTLSNHEFNVSIFLHSYTSIVKCWSEGVYVQKLFLKFFKLTLQIVSRLNKWIELICTGHQRPGDAEIWNSTNFMKFNFFLLIYIDIINLNSRLETIQTIVRDNMPNVLADNWNLIELSFKNVNTELTEKLNTIENFVINELIADAVSNIKYVNDIPRLYRKTNKDIPSRPCHYVDQLIQPIKNFDKSYGTIVAIDKIKLFKIILSKITVQYYTAVDDVLVSVQKTEESLRRLKNLRDKTTSSSHAAMNASNQMTDDDKIRLQLQVDVGTWAKEIDKLNIEIGDVQKLNELIGLVEIANKTKASENN